MSTTSTITEAAPRQLDIDYHPDHVKYLARTARRLQSDPSLPKSPLPAGFPTQVEGPIVWEGADWKEEKQWVYELSQVELKEIDDAIKHFQGIDLSSHRLLRFVDIHSKVLVSLLAT